MPPPRTILLGVSGPSSSGKTTLARLLRNILPSAFILHLDDFYHTDARIPVHDGLQDWDCLAALDLPAFEAALRHIKTHAAPPPALVSLEDQNAVGTSGVDGAAVERWKSVLREDEGWRRVLGLDDNVAEGEKEEPVKVAIVDGFLLYSPEMPAIRALFDTKLFLRTTYATAKRRREARKGYVTLEGFWEDPPGYVDKIVWPNYVRDHAFLFEEGDVEGRLKEDVCRETGIRPMPKEFQEDMTGCLGWALGMLKEGLQTLSGDGEKTSSGALPWR